MKRYLSTEEIENIIQEIKSEMNTINNLPTIMKNIFFDNFFTPIKKSLQSIQIIPKGIPILTETLKKKYRLVIPGKSVGIITGQSIGEMQTQTTLNTFHKAGLTEKTVVTGVPRFLEIIDTNRSETQSTPCCYIYLNDRPKTVVEARNIVGHHLVYFTFGKLIQNYESNIFEPQKWYTDTTKQYKYCLKYYMNLEILFRYKITLKYIKEKLDQVLSSEQYAVFISPLHMGQIDICLFQDDSVEIETKIHSNIIKIHISGISNIENIFFMKSNDTDEWYIETDGTNLAQISELHFVDIYRTYSNDIWEIYNIYGIEAIRKYLYFELEMLMPSIHKTHLSILVDRMTISGKLRSISRYTRKNEQTSVLSKATFEETLSNFIQASLNREKDTINGSSATITCGKVPFVGTGMNELLLE